MVAIKPATLRDVTFVAANMRDQDWREVYASAPCDDRLQAGYLCYALSRWSYTAWLKDEPVCAFGFAMTHLPWLGTAWAFGTDRMKRAIPAVSRHGKAMRQEFIDAGLRRIEVRSLAGHDLAHGWLSALDAKREAELPHYGRDGETFILYAWTR